MQRTTAVEVEPMPMTVISWRNMGVSLNGP